MFTEDCVTAPTKDIPVEDGFYPTKAGYVWAGGILNYTCCRIAPNAFMTFRNEFWDDPHGYRSGYSSTYYEGSFGVNWWPNKLLCMRPEVRFEHSFKENGLEELHGTGQSYGNRAGGDARRLRQRHAPKPAHLRD